MIDNGVVKVDRIAALERVATLAGMVVLETPVHSANSHQSYVRRALIAEIEEALVATGLDMKGARKLLEEKKRVRWTREPPLPPGATTVVNVVE